MARLVSHLLAHLQKTVLGLGTYPSERHAAGRSRLLPWTRSRDGALVTALSWRRSLTHSMAFLSRDRCTGQSPSLWYCSSSWRTASCSASSAREDPTHSSSRWATATCC